MNKIVLFVIFFTILTVAQNNNCACCSSEHNQFDFWIGEWVVYDTSSNVVGTNTIIKDYDNCLLQENWISQGKNRGTSYNYFNIKDTTWNQLWVDNQGTILKLKGRFIDGKMVLKSELLKGKKVDWYYNRITWQPKENGTVEQIWDILDKNNNLLANVFFGIYKRQDE